MVKTCYNEEYFTSIGYSKEQAAEFINTLSGQEADSLKFYRMLGYSLVESEYLAVNTFNTVKTPVAKASLGVPVGFSKTRSAVMSSVVQTTQAMFGGFDSGFDDFGASPQEANVFDNADANFDDLDALFSSDDSAPDDGAGFDESVEEYDDCEESYDIDMDMMESCDAAPSSAASANYMSNLVNSAGSTPAHVPEERYTRIANKSGFKDVVTSPTSTFKATVNTASFNYIKDHILGKSYGQLYEDAVRTEEVINYFDYKFENRLNAELSSFRDKNYLLVGIKGDKVENLRNNIVLLVDTSGSMGRSDVLLQKAIMTIVKQLGPNDLLSLITYSTEDRVIFTALQADKLSDIILSLNKVNIEGCTNGSAGLTKAYEIASKHFIENGNNRIVILTDGDFNFGTYNQSELSKFIKEKKKTGVFLTVIGTSESEVYEEQLMETLARDGNGNYFRVSDEIDILETLQKRFTKNSIAVAKDVKMQIEFNPAVVDKYRLVGYETRQLSHEDFRNDNVESETLGNEQVVVALYELVLTDSKKGALKSVFKYQKINTTDSTDIGTLYLRYKGIKTVDTESQEESLEIPNEKIEATQNMLQALLAERLAEFATQPSDKLFKEVCKILAQIQDDEDAKFDLVRSLVDRLKGFTK